MSRFWVLGAGSGIGEWVANDLRKLGHEVLQSGKADADVRNYPALEGIARRHGPFDGVVFSAGINQLAWIEDLSDGLMGRMFQTNVFGFTNLMRALAITHPQGCRVVAVTSDAAVRPMRGSTAYCASKAALEMCVKVAARELGARGFSVNSVAPGMTEPTDMQKQLDEEIPEFRGWTPDQALSYELSSNPMGRRAHTSEVSEMIVSVLNMPEYVNGATFTINGGR